MLFFNPKPVFKQLSYSKILKKYKPYKDYEEKMNYMAYEGVLAFFGVIQCSMGEAINSHIKFVQESEKDLLKSDKNLIYSTAFDFFALLYVIFEKKLEERGIDEFSFSEVLTKTYYFYFNEFFSDSIRIYPKHGCEFNQKHNFKSYNEALVQKKMLYANLIERLRSNLDNQHKLFEAYKTLYAFLVLSPSFYNGNKFDELTIDIMATTWIGKDPEESKMLLGKAFDANRPFFLTPPANADEYLQRAIKFINTKAQDDMFYIDLSYSFKTGNVEVAKFAKKTKEFGAAGVDTRIRFYVEDNKGTFLNPKKYLAIPPEVYASQAAEVKASSFGIFKRSQFYSYSTSRTASPSLKWF